jgi:hypothetical protein
LTWHESANANVIDLTWHNLEIFVDMLPLDVLFIEELEHVDLPAVEEGSRVSY